MLTSAQWGDGLVDNPAGRTVAVVGLSPKPERDSHHVAQYLQAQGYRIVPINPSATEILGERSWPSLTEAAKHHRIDLVDVFRDSAAVPHIADEAMAIGATVAGGLGGALGAISGSSALAAASSSPERDPSRLAFNMAGGILAMTAGATASLPRPSLSWEDPRLMFVVREPFISRHSRAGVVAGIVEPSEELRLESAMPASGVIFSDGVEADYLNFNSGAVAHIRAAPQKAHLVVP